MQVTRLTIEGAEALDVTDDDGSAFWIIPQRQLAILNITNPGRQRGRGPAGDVAEGNRRARAGTVKGARIGSKPGEAGAQDARHGHESQLRSAEGFLDSREFARMTRAIEFIEREYQRQPKLAEIARFVGLSEFHFNRLFRRWTGLTPKQYLAEVTSRAAGTALRSEPSVLDAAHSVGLSGGGRLHDLTVSLEAMTPGEIRAGGAGVNIRHGVADTPFGTAFIAETERGLCRLAFLDGASETAELRALRDAVAQGRIRARRRAG